MGHGHPRRATTVHDRAALRVHPDGTRVTARESRYATKDLRGNRVAVNAGGTGNVKKRRRAAISDDGSEPPEEFDIQTDEYQPSENPSSTDSCAGVIEAESGEESGKRKRQKKDPRRAKRTEFYQNFDFVLGGKSGTGTVSASDDPLLPSSVGWVFNHIWWTANSDESGSAQVPPPLRCNILLQQRPARGCFEDSPPKEEGENECCCGNQVQFSGNFRRRV